MLLAEYRGPLYELQGAYVLHVECSDFSDFSFPVLDVGGNLILRSKYLHNTIFDNSSCFCTSLIFVHKNTNEVLNM